MFTILKKNSTFDTQHEARQFFNQCTSSHIQLEFFIRFPSGKGEILEEIKQITLTSLSLNSRIKLCLRLRLHPNKVGKSLVQGVLTCKQLENKKSELLQQMGHGDKKVLFRRYDQINSQLSKIVQKVHLDAMKYLLWVHLPDIAMEDNQYYFHLIKHEETLLQIKDTLKDNKHPIMSFLCSSTDLCGENQQVFAYVTI